ncbi:MAG: Bug family tripartite tricarboxylate transporter substrate binding protein [Xanthobacteraceae bacterium]
MKRFFLGAMLIALATPAAAAEVFPSRSITFVVPYAAGGGTDRAARRVAAGLAEQLKVSVVVDNRLGAGGTIAATSVANSEPNGYTLFFSGSGVFTSVHALQKAPKYDPVKSFVPIIQVARGRYMFVIRDGLPVKTLAEFIAFAKRERGKLNYGSLGPGSVNHIGMQVFNKAAGIEAVPVPYKGSALAWNGLASGEIDFILDGVPGPVGLLQAGKARTLAVTGDRRFAALPDVPTLPEVGVKGVDILFWWGLLAPAGTPPDIVKTLHDAVESVLKDEGVQKTFRDLNVELIAGSSQAFATEIAADVIRWRTYVAPAWPPNS